MFNWNEPPEGGHPGQEFCCKCMAEPMIAEHQLPIKFQNPGNPLLYADLVESGLINKFNKMIEDKNKFIDAYNAWFALDQRIKEGEKVPSTDVNAALVKRVRTRDDAAKSAAEFEKAMRASVPVRTE